DPASGPAARFHPPYVRTPSPSFQHRDMARRLRQWCCRERSSLATAHSRMSTRMSYRNDGGNTMENRYQNQFTPQNGMDVTGADGEKVGEIDGVERNYFVVRKGFFFPQDHYIPMTAISSYDDNAVYLNVTREEALEQEWTSPPVEATTTAEQETQINAGG